MSAFSNTFQGTFGSVQKGSLLKQILLEFTCAENQTTVGRIEEEGSTFEITEGHTIFEISESGVITFKVAPDYETQAFYSLVVKSSKNKLYRISVYVTDAISLFALNTNTVLNLATAI